MGREKMFQEYPDVLTPQQVQEMLGVGQRMAYQLLREGKIQNVRMGKLYRVPKAAVIDYLYSGKGAERT